MRRLKRGLSWLLVLIFFTSVTVIESKAVANKTSGQILQALNIISGDENGNLLEQNKATRQDLAAMVCKLMGWKGLAETTLYKEKNKFKDISVANGNSWLAGYAAIMYEKGVTVGTSTVPLLFSPKQNITFKEFYVWIYRAMCPNAEDGFYRMELLVDAGLLSAEQTIQVNEDYISKKYPTRGQLFDAMYEILSNNTELVDALIANKTFTKLQADAAGLCYTTTSDKTIVSAEIINYMQLRVNWEGTADATKGHYYIKNMEISSVVFGADNKQVLINLKDRISSNTDIVLFYADGDPINNPEQKFALKGIVDNVAPYATQVKTSGVNQFSVTFSEPVLNSSVSVKLDNGYTTVVKQGVLTEYAQSIDFTVPAGLTNNKEYEVIINKGMKDTAGIVMNEDKKLSYTYIEKNAQITAMISYATEQKLVFKLSEKVTEAKQTAFNEAGTLTEANFSYIFDNTHPSQAYMENRDTVTLVFGNYPVPVGTWSLTIRDAKTMFVDEWGNAGAASNIVLDFIVKQDTLAPKVSNILFYQSAIASDNKIVIDFDEEIAYGLSVKVYRDKVDVTNTVILPNSGTWSDANKKYTCLTVGSAFETGEYIIEVKDGRDLSGNLMQTTRKAVNAIAVRKLKIEKIEYIIDENKNAVKYYIHFDNSMANAVLNENNWSFSVPSVATDSAVNEWEAKHIDKIYFKDILKKIVVLEFTAVNAPSARMLANSEIVPSDYLKLDLIKAVVDISNNSLYETDYLADEQLVKVISTAFSTNLSIRAREISSRDILLAETTSLRAISATEVEFVIKEKLDLLSISTDCFTFESDGVISKAAEIVGTPIYDEEGYTTIRMKVIPFSGVVPISNSGTGVNGEPIICRISGIRTSDGVILTDETSLTLKDSITPTIASYIYKETERAVELTVSEGIVVNPREMFATELTITADNRTLYPSLDYTVTLVDSNGSTIITVRLNNVASNITVALKKESVYAKDRAENSLKPFSVTIEN